MLVSFLFVCVFLEFAGVSPRSVVKSLSSGFALLFFLGDNAVAEFRLEELTYSHSGGNGLKKQ